MRHFSRLFHSLVVLAVVAGFGSTGCVSGSSGSAGRDTLSAGCDTLGADSSALRAVAEHRPANGIYYWRTVFDPSAEEIGFLRDHQVRRLYIRFFDVDRDFDNVGEQTAIPVATAIFRQQPDSALEIVPTVYVTIEAFRTIVATDGIVEYASRVVDRLRRMIRTNGIRNVREVQIDCDWTESTQTPYFQFLEEICALFASEGIALSATIRLWQLAAAVPPVDRGVLMCYNTGYVTDPGERNSIIDPARILPYLSLLPNYGLPLDSALPTFGWSVWFRDGKFRALVRTTDCSDRSLYEPLGGNNYRVLRDHNVVEKQLRAGDVLRLETAPFESLCAVKQAVEAKRRPGAASVLLYHLEQNNLVKYASHEIDSLYSLR